LLRERSYCPLPAVAELADNAECTFVGWKRVDVRRIPAVEIKIAEILRGCAGAPGIIALGALRRAIGGAMPLRFSWQGGVCPTSIGAGFSMANVDGPIRWKWQRFKHAVIGPRGA